MRFLSRNAKARLRHVQKSPKACARIRETEKTGVWDEKTLPPLGVVKSMFKPAAAKGSSARVGPNHPLRKEFPVSPLRVSFRCQFQSHANVLQKWDQLAWDEMMELLVHVESDKGAAGLNKHNLRIPRVGVDKNVPWLWRKNHCPKDVDAGLVGTWRLF
jgi:hypothetical protein